MSHDAAARPVRTGFTALSGTLVGAAISAPILAGSSWLAKRMGDAPDPISAGASLGAPYASFIVALAVGGALGATLSLAMVRSARLRARLIFSPVFSVLLYLCAHVVLLSRHAQTLPLVPMLLAALAFGVCLAFAPPFERR